LGRSSMTTPVLTPTPQDRALIAMLRDFEERRRHPIDEHDGPYYIGIVIFTHIPEEDEDGEEMMSDATLWWRVHLTLGGFETEGEGASFAAAWDKMIVEGDADLDENLRHLKEQGIAGAVGLVELSQQLSPGSDAAHGPGDGADHEPAPPGGDAY
jgi:hypothetical protein